MKPKKEFSRREFLKLSAMTLSGLAFTGGGTRRVLGNRFYRPNHQPSAELFPVDTPLGRICVGAPGSRVDIKAEPYWEASTVGSAWYDDVFEWKQEVIAKQIDPLRVNQRWVAMPEGYIYADYVQKTHYLPQTPLDQLPETPTGERGMWVEVFAPYLDLILTKPKNHYQHWIRNEDNLKPRIYYSQVFWAFDTRKDPETGAAQYCLKQLYGVNTPDSYWVDASACRQITPEEIAPIHPGAENKRVLIDLDHQVLTCFEGDQEVFFARVSTGGWNAEDEKWSTPLGVHTTWRKMVSTNMSAGPAVGNYDIPGVGWTLVFDPYGAAIHSTFWHNYYGTMRSHGCINMKPEDAKWVWRWTEPEVSYFPGDWIASGLVKPTQVEVIKA